MNYLKQLNLFNELKMQNPVSANAQCLYINLLHVNNRNHWKEEFSISNSYMMALTCLSRQALDRARNELKQKGYIEYTKGSGNQPGTYLIVRFDTQIDTQLYTQIDTPLLHKCIHTSNNINKNKNINNNNQRKYKEDELNFFYINGGIHEKTR
jgi:hypothetical protein